ncbi:trypsin-like peptidase domain-containing protein [Yoonia sp. SS1-5]|uniref:Serine protease n=1 Tax=Yoonia rhodophyticola TaxID=3137370 RepID=A0AAN0NK77_9RHOB
MRDLIADGASQDAIDALLPFLASQMGPAAEPRTLRRFKAFRDEALLHASGLARLPARRRKGIDDPDRLDREEMRLTGAVTELISDIDDALRSAKAAVPAAPPPMADDLASAVPEKVIGRGNLQGLAWLLQGAKAGAPVCRVMTPTAIGTGFLVAGGLVVTNNHVVPDAMMAAQATVEFNYERDEAGQLKQSVIYKIRADGFYTLPGSLDCTVMQIDAPADDLAQWGHLSIDPQSAPAIGDPVAIIQHPNGGEKQVAVTANEVVAVQDGRLAYLTDTLGGSSGAPVFNERWRVVALHRAGGALVDGPDGRHMRANEGVMFSRLLQDDGLRDALGLS